MEEIDVEMKPAWLGKGSPAEGAGYLVSGPNLAKPLFPGLSLPTYKGVGSWTNRARGSF